MIKNLSELNTPSKGAEMLQRLENEPKIKDVSTINHPTEEPQSDPVKPVDTKDDQFRSMIKDGVEVVDVKAIEKGKIGIPIKPGERKNFDKIG